jgi:hypothetical protein
MRLFAPIIRFILSFTFAWNNTFVRGTGINRANADMFLGAPLEEGDTMADYYLVNDFTDARRT